MLEDGCQLGSLVLYSVEKLLNNISVCHIGSCFFFHMRGWENRGLGSGEKGDGYAVLRVPDDKQEQPIYG